MDDDDDDYRTMSPESVASWVTDNGPTIDPHSQAVLDTELELEPNSRQNTDTSMDQDDSDDSADEEFEDIQLQERMRAYSRILGVPMPYMNHVQEQQREPCQDDQGKCDESSPSPAVEVQPVPLPLPISHHESDDSSSSLRTCSENDNTDDSVSERQEVDELELPIDDNEDGMPESSLTDIPTTPSVGEDRQSSEGDSEITFESLPSLTACKRRRLRLATSQ